MPKETILRQSIDEIYKKNFEDISLFFYVQGMQRALPAISDRKCVELWLLTMDLSEEQYPFQTALNNYVNMKKLFLKL